MNTALSTLWNLAGLIAAVALGAFLGSRPAVRAKPLPWLSKLQLAALMILIVSLGVKLGADDEVISSLAEIGWTAFLITVAAMAGSVLALWLLRRFVLRLDRRGLPAGSGEEAESGGEGGQKADNSLTKWIVGAVALGMLAGYFLVPESIVAYCGQVIDLGLYLLLFLVGVDMGLQGTVVSDIKAAGFKVLLIPVVVAAGSLGAAALVGLALEIGPKDAMAVSAGLGWYSLAPSLLAPYSLPVSAVCFLSNVMREVFSILTIPLVARRVGFVESVALPGAAAMDTVLPVVVGATHERITIYSFTSGVILSLAVPLLVSAVMAL
nr:lysine exporter LysO family protein [uncultured Oscillibacter sp.]